MLDLDDPETRDAVAADPSTMIQSDSPICIDAYQHAPAVLDAIKARLNRSSRPGQFVLTGSARHESRPAATQALTGRLNRMTVYPLAQAEIKAACPDLLGRPLAASAAGHSRASTTSRQDYLERSRRAYRPRRTRVSKPERQ